MAPPSLPSTRSLHHFREVLNIQLREEAQVSSFSHSHKAGKQQPIMRCPSHSSGTNHVGGGYPETVVRRGLNTELHI